MGYGMATPNYAGWGSRVVATIIDGLVAIPFVLPGYILSFAGAAGSDGQGGSGALTGIGTLLILAGVVGFLVMYCRKLGSTGQTWGRKAMGYKIVDKDTHQPIGAGKAFGRYVARIIDGIPCYLGYLWPLWDKNKQTFSDKLLNTIAVKA